MASGLGYEVARLLKAAENRLCADCTAPLTDVSAAYASLTFGVWICPACAQSHYKVLADESKLKKAVGAWSAEEIRTMVKAKNNLVSNSIYERFVPDGWRKITPDVSLQERDDWVQAKYFSFFFAIPQKAGSTTKFRVDREERIEAQSTLPTRIVDYFLTMDAGKPKAAKDPSKLNKVEDILFNVDIRDCYPRSGTYPDTPLPDLVGPMVFPHGLKLSMHDHAPFSFTFVLTDINRVKFFGAALIVHELVDRERLEGLLGGTLFQRLPNPQQVYYAPRALTVLSHYPFYTLLSKFLAQIYKVSLSVSPLPIERYIVNFMQELPLPPQGRVEVLYTLPELLLQISRPPKNHLPLVDFSYRPLFAYLSVENILTIFTCLCLEMTVCICASNIALLTPVQEALLSLLFPFVWQGCYVPILPQHMMELLDAPVPLLVGVHDSYLIDTHPQLRPCNVVFVHLDTDSVIYGEEDDLLTSQPILQLPKSKADKLRDKLRKFAGCIHRKDLAVYSDAGKPFPNNEHLIPIKSFLSEQGVLSQTQQKQGLFSTSDLLQAQQRHGIRAVGVAPKAAATAHAVPYRHPVACTIVVASSADDNCKAFNSTTALDSEHNFAGKEDGQFNALEVREAFLRFFVASFMDYQNFINHSGVKERKASLISKKLGSLVSGSARHSSGSGDCSSVHSESTLLESDAGSLCGRPNFFNKDAYIAQLQDEFLAQMVESQMFSNFISERLQGFEQVEIRFFDENILAKGNRSILNVSKSGTPFLSDDSDYLRETFSVPSPSTAGLGVEQHFSYPSFPTIQPVNIGTVRKPKVLIQAPEMRRLEGEAGRKVLLEQLAALQARDKDCEELGDQNGPTPEQLFAMARKRYLSAVTALSHLQRRAVCRVHMRHLRRALMAIRLIQRAYTCFVSRRRRRLRIYQAQCKKLQAIWRMYVLRSKYRRARWLAVLLQSRLRARRQRAQYLRIFSAFCKVQAIASGRNLRRRVRKYLQHQIDMRGRLMVCLWVMDCTPLLRRAMVLTILTKCTFLHLALLDEQLQSLYESLGIADSSSVLHATKQHIYVALTSEPAVGPGSLLDRRPSSQIPASFARLSRDEKAVVAEELVAVRKLRVLFNNQSGDLQLVAASASRVAALMRETFGSEPSGRHWQRASQEEAERAELYKILKSNQNKESRRYEDFYRVLGLPDPKKRKQRLCSNLFHLGGEDQLRKEAAFLLYAHALQEGLPETQLREQWEGAITGPRLRKHCVEGLNACLTSLQRRHGPHDKRAGTAK